MTEKHFISVILPLRLEWEPCYFSYEPLNEGDRVKVLFAGKEYIGTVSGTGIKPDIDINRINPVISAERGIGNIRREEIRLWREVAEYYMCSIGEVYKAAYPIGKINLEEAREAARRKVVERRERILAAVEAKIGKLQVRLEKKQELAAKAKEGTKAREKYLADIDRLMLEIESAEEARLKAISGIRAAEEGATMVSGTVPDSPICLSDVQKKAYNEITEGFSTGKPVLLHGVTGSGKTEIYMKLAQEQISRGRNVLYLVPEIALSRQLEDRLREQFGDRLIIFHSGESAASRRDSAEIIRNMTADKGGYIALCTRSGLFLPHHDLGIIIVDEEHDSSYKQDSPAPRYNGRDTALMLSRIQGCNIILGSATPSLEELYNTMTGRHRLVELKERYHGSEDAEVEIIDTKAERRKRGMSGNFSRKLIDHINKALEEGGQVLILRSRRAWASVLQCGQCGEIQKCPHCNVSLSYHKDSGRMVCHYCGFALAHTGVCGKCGGTLTGLGAGTQKIEEEAAALFPNAGIARLDSDTAQNKTFRTKAIQDFAKGDIDILIGTQIITKGFDFDRLSLVAVIAADTLLGVQDFRADEKAIQLLEQFRGRCGRRGKKGLFIIQTSQPEHPVYQNITQNTQTDFNNRLLAERKDFSFPPYTRIIELTVKDIYQDRAERMAGRLAGLLQGFNITGPYSPVVDRIADHYVRKIRISLKKDRFLVSMKSSLRSIIREFEKSYRYTDHITIDVDPA